MFYSQTDTYTVKKKEADRAGREIAQKKSHRQIGADTDSDTLYLLY